jgi:hypothetical protein
MPFHDSIVEMHLPFYSIRAHLESEWNVDWWDLDLAV